MNKYNLEKIEFLCNLDKNRYAELSQNILIEISSNRHSYIQASIKKVLKIQLVSIQLYYYTIKYWYKLKYGKIDHDSNYLYLLLSLDHNMIQ